jgi:hypothetical protein
MMVLDAFFALLRFVWWCFSMRSAFVDWFQLGSVDLDFIWDTDRQSCGFPNIVSKVLETLLSPSAVTLREMYVKCACEMGTCDGVPMAILTKIALPFHVMMLHLILRGNWVLFVSFEVYNMRHYVGCVKEGVESSFTWFKACFRSDTVQSGVACVKVSLPSAEVQPKLLPDEDFEKILRRLQTSLYRESLVLDERLQKRMSDLLLCIPDYAIGTRWGIRMGSAEDFQKGIEMKDQKLFRTVQFQRKMIFSGEEWSSHCTEKITPDHYMREEDFLYYPMPLDFGRKEDRKAINDALKDAAFRVELEKQPDLCRDILALHA